MKKLLYVFLLFAITSCAKKKWNKETVTAECMASLSNNKDAMLLNEDQKKQICDCGTVKILAKYNSEAELEKDQAGGSDIYRDCTIQVMMPNTPDNTMPQMDTTTNPVDTTNQ